MMKQILLFSVLTENNQSEILKHLFPENLKDKVLAYMPCDGANSPQKYTDLWKKYAHDHQTEFLYVDNSLINSVSESEKILKSNILLITGGSTFTLLNNLRKSGLDKTIISFTHKNEFVLAGFSAGAIILTPTINICNLPDYDENLVGLKDLTGLNLVDFEVFPHFDPSLHQEVLNQYQSNNRNDVKPISNDNYLLIDKI